MSAPGHESLNETSKALLVSAHAVGEPIEDSKTLLEELESLVDTLGILVADAKLANIKRPNHRFLLGEGKAAELSEQAKQGAMDVIVFDNELSPAQQRNWEKLSGLAVIDREEVILEIFARRARTREARLQIGLALMEYSLPRLKRAWAHLSRQGGGLGSKGEGETQLETDRRIVRRRIEQYRRQLTEIRADRATQRKQRQRRPVPVGAIVGYTNAGKSSLLRALTGANVLVEDRLFATLDTTTRRLELPNGQTVLLTDTVGFVRRLPHRLVESFKATLEEAAEADFLIHVLDVTNRLFREFHKTTLGVLAELGADAKPMITVFNKIDLVEDLEVIQEVRNEFPDAVFVTTRNPASFDDLFVAIARLAQTEQRQLELLLPITRGDLLNRLHSVAHVLHEEFTEHGIRVVARIPTRWLKTFEPFESPPLVA